jgi:hypothetical protein
MVATQRIHVGMIHARKILTVTAGDNAFQLDIDGETVATVPCTSGRDPPVQGLRHQDRQTLSPYPPSRDSLRPRKLMRIS